MSDVPERSFPWWTVIAPLLPTLGVLIAQQVRSADLVYVAIFAGSPLCGLAAGARLAWVPGRSLVRRMIALVLIGAGLTVGAACLAIGGCCMTNDPARAFRIS